MDNRQKITILNTRTGGHIKREFVMTDTRGNYQLGSMLRWAIKQDKNDSISRSTITVRIEDIESSDL